MPLKLSEVIKKLQACQKEIGDAVVEISVDEEGNEFKEVHAIEICEREKGGVGVTIWPLG